MISLSDETDVVTFVEHDTVECKTAAKVHAVMFPSLSLTKTNKGFLPILAAASRNKI